MCIEQATKTANFKPRTNHISIKWHQFKDKVANGNSTIIKVGTDAIIADLFTKLQVNK